MNAPFEFPPYESLLLLLLLLVHATFQLGAGLLTLLSSHSLGRQRSLRQLLFLNTAYIVGSSVMLSVLILAGVYAMLITGRYIPANMEWLWIIASLCAIAAAIAIWYFRQGSGTALWLPRVFADALTRRVKKASSPTDAAILGAIAVCSELPLSGVIIVTVAHTLLQPSLLEHQSLLVALYTIGVNLPLIIITIMVAGGHRISTIQRWREANKSFLQYASAVGLIVIAFTVWIFFIYEKVAS